MQDKLNRKGEYVVRDVAYSTQDAEQVDLQRSLQKIIYDTTMQEYARHH
jgi:hypothetical protein